MQEGEVYLGRGRKGNIRKESRKRERTWRYAVGKKRNWGREGKGNNREHRQQREAKHTGVKDEKT
jgi:hypothetical protein